MDPSREPVKVTDLSGLKALSHPTRVRMLYVLKANGPMTASQLGDAVDESPASMSYHLRQLATHGLAEEIEHGADRRQRWWKALDNGFAWSPTDFAGSPEMQSATKSAKDVYLAHQWDRLREHNRIEESWGAQWVDSAFSVDNVLRLTAAETSTLGDELQEVLDRWRTRSDENAAVQVDDSESVMVIMHGFPTTF